MKICFEHYMGKCGPWKLNLPISYVPGSVRCSSVLCLFKVLIKHLYSLSHYFFLFFCHIYIFRHINEDKRKTESQMEMFDIVNDIDSCPVSYFCSSCRLFILHFLVLVFLDMTPLQYMIIVRGICSLF